MCMTRWLITVHIFNNNDYFDPVQRSRIFNIRGLFKDSGFAVILKESLYYNPHNQRMFYVEHVKESAITMFLLKYNLAGHLTVEQV